MTMISTFALFLVAVTALMTVQGFSPLLGASAAVGRQSLQLHAETIVQQASGEQLELMMQDWEAGPLVVDAYATWCGPCLLMAPEFEAAAKELEGRVRFAKLDTDKEEQMAARLNIMGLPTLLFLDKYDGNGDDKQPEASAVLKGRLEGALRKDMIVGLCEYYFFDGPLPEGMAKN